MPTQDKVMLMHKVEETLKPRMFANLLEQAVEDIQGHLDEFDIRHIAQPDTQENDDLLSAFMAAKRTAGLTEKTLVLYRYTIERFMKYIGVRTRDVTKHHVLSYLEHESQRGICDTTVEGTRQKLSSFFGWLSLEKLIPNNPMVNVPPIRCEKKVKESFSVNDLDRIKRACGNIRNLAIIHFLFATGCRISEVTSLDRKDVNLDSGECVVYGKGRKERPVFMDDSCIIVLREYLCTRTDDAEPLFVNRYGERMSPCGIRTMLKTLADKAGVENVHPHRFRRTMITRLLNRGMPIQEVCVLAGHAKIDTTMGYFSSSKNRIRSSYRLYTD